jgi:hypothetical protein
MYKLKVDDSSKTRLMKWIYCTGSNIMIYDFFDDQLNVKSISVVVVIFGAVDVIG